MATRMIDRSIGDSGAGQSQPGDTSNTAARAFRPACRDGRCVAARPNPSETRRRDAIGRPRAGQRRRSTSTALGRVVVDCVVGSVRCTVRACTCYTARRGARPPVTRRPSIVWPPGGRRWQAASSAARTSEVYGEPRTQHSLLPVGAPSRAHARASPCVFRATNRNHLA